MARDRLVLVEGTNRVVPKHVTVVDDFPRTAAGKVQKHLLRVRLTGERGP